MSAATYKKWVHKTAVERAAEEAGIRGAASKILVYLCRISEAERPFVRVSKETIAERTTYCTKTVKAALATLREAGFLHPVAYAQGGRGRCPVYLIRTGKGGKNFPPLDGETGYKGGKNFPEKGGSLFQKRGEESSPPLGTSSGISSEKEEGAASSGGRAVRALDGGAGPATRPATRQAVVQWVKPSEVRALLLGWGYSGEEIDGFTSRDVSGVLTAQGMRLGLENLP